MARTGQEEKGKIRQLIADGQGRVHAPLVRVAGAKAVIPASNFMCHGNVAISAMGKGMIKRIADQQDLTGANDI